MSVRKREERRRGVEEEGERDGEREREGWKKRKIGMDKDDG